MLRIPLPAADLARLDRLRVRVPLATRKTALAAEVLRVGLDLVERDPSALFRAVLADPVEPVEPIEPSPPLPQLSPNPSA